MRQLTRAPRAAPLLRSLVLCSSLVLLLAGCLSGTSKQSYVARNTRILDSLPRVPGARALHTLSTGLQTKDDSSGPPYSDYVTVRYYGLARPKLGTAIVSFYRRHLPRWVYVSGIPCDETIRSPKGEQVEIVACGGSSPMRRFHVRVIAGH